MVNGYISWICKSVGWFWTWDTLFHSGRLSVRCEEDWKTVKPHSRKFLHSDKKKTKHVFAVIEKYQWNEIHFKTYQYLVYFSGNNFIFCPDFVTSGKRNFVEFE